MSTKYLENINQKRLSVARSVTALFSFPCVCVGEARLQKMFLIYRKMKIDLDREKGLELFGKLIRTKNIESLQGDQPKTGPEPLHPADSKQKLQVKIILINNMI